MPQNYDLGRRVRKPQGQSSFGNKDLSGLAPMEEILGTVTKGIIAKRQAEIAQEREALEKNYIDQSMSRLNNVLRGPRGLAASEVNKALDQETVQLLRHGGTKSRQTASDIQKLRKQEKMDTSLTADEAYIRGHITFDQYEAMKKAGKATGKPSFRWRQKTVNGKPATEKVGTKVHLIEEEVDIEGKPTGGTRLKGVTEARSSLIGWGSGGKSSFDIPIGVDATTGKPIVRQIEGTKEDVIKQIRTSAKGIDATVRKFAKSEGSKGFLGFGVKDSWDKFITDDTTKLEDLPENIRPYAIVYEELLTKLSELEGNTDQPVNKGAGYSWEFVEEEEEN